MGNALGKQLYHVMSITQAAIGLCYAFQQKRNGANLARKRLWPKRVLYNNSKVPQPSALPPVSILEALNHTSGLSDDTWDYDDYRNSVATANALNFATNRLCQAKFAPGRHFQYNNLVWHVLSARYFEMFGETAQTTLQQLLGSAVSWETDSNNIPLGPHGLRLSKKQAVKMGTLAPIYIGCMEPQILVPSSALPDTVCAVFGWYVSKQCIWAHGHPHFYILYRKRDKTTHVQLCIAENTTTDQFVQNKCS